MKPFEEVHKVCRVEFFNSINRCITKYGLKIKKDDTIENIKNKNMNQTLA